MLISPRRIQGAYDSFQRYGSEAQSDALVRHLRFKQQQVWSSSSAILTYDGVMTAALVIGDRDHKLYVPVTLVFLVSAVSCVISLNLHGTFGDVRSFEEGQQVNLTVLKIGGFLCLVSLWLSLIATATFAAMLVHLL
jgi:hypothetical protein